MMKNLCKTIYRNHFILLILIISFIVSIIIMNFHINQYGKVLSNSQKFPGPRLLASPVELNLWEKAYKIKNKDLQISNIQDYEFRHHFLPPKILGLVGKFFGIKFYENDVGTKFYDNDKYNFDGIYKFFLFQVILFYLSIIFFYKKLKKLNLDKNIINISICFLLFDPTINQYKYTVFGETIFFTILIFIFSFLIDLPKKKLSYLFLGFLIGICYLQRSVAIFLIIVPIVVLIVRFKLGSILKIINLSISFSIILLVVGYLNFDRTNIFYVLPTQTIDNLYNYFLPGVVKIKNNSNSDTDVKVKLSQKKLDFAEKKNLNLNQETDRIVWYKWQRDRALDTMLNDKILTIKVAIKSSLHSTLLNPTEIISKRIYGVNYYKSDLHQKTIKFRIIYSLIFYSLIFIGFIYTLKKKIYFPHILLLVAIYFFAISSWVGYTRYFVPTYICLCLYFGCGVYYVSCFLKKKLIQ